MFFFSVICASFAFLIVIFWKTIVAVQLICVKEVANRPMFVVPLQFSGLLFSTIRKAQENKRYECSEQLYLTDFSYFHKTMKVMLNKL